MTLRESMALSGRNLVATLSPAQGYLPYWSLEFDRDLAAHCHVFWPSHNVGRVWDALLRLEAATGIRVPGEIETPMLRNVEACLDNPLGVCCYLTERDGIPHKPDPAGWFDNHSQRELLLALASLARYRPAGRAASLAAGMVTALDRHIRPDGDWDIPAMARACRQAGIQVTDEQEKIYDDMHGFRHIESHGRLLEALLELHAVTGYAPALALATRLGAFHFDVSTRADGEAPEAEHTHTHSYLNTLRGLLLLGQVTGRREYIERVATTYRVTVRRYVRRTGFVSHDLRTERDGETGSLGDVIQLALRLGHLDDAERLVRCRLLPTQITKPIGLRPAAEDGDDRHASLEARALGAFGGMIRHTHGGHHPTTDISAADLHALAEVYSGVVEDRGDALRVNFHFDYEDARLRIRTTRAETCRVEIRLAAPRELEVRIPGWVAVDSVVTTTESGGAVGRTGADRFLRVPRGPLGVTLEYPLPRETVTERIDGVDYRVGWRGDEIVGISPNTDWLPFYPTLG